MKRKVVFAEGRRDREHRQRTAPAASAAVLDIAVAVKALDVRDEGRAALIQQAEGAVDFLHLQHHGPTPRMLAQVAPGAPPSRSAGG